MSKTKLDDALTTLSGAKIMLTVNKELTYRSALVSVCETYQGEPNSGDTLKAYNLGIKIINTKDELKFAEDEVVFLKKIIENNPAFMAVVIGRLLDFIKIN